MGRTLSLVILSTHGDSNYVGLNGLEILSADGSIVPVSQAEAVAEPDSCNVLPGATGNDPRTPDKLLNGANSSWEGADSWLAPWTPGLTARVWVHLPAPVVLGAVRLWNYSRSPDRGAAEVSLSPAVASQARALPLRAMAAQPRRAGIFEPNSDAQTESVILRLLQVQLLLDGVLLFHGVLRPAPPRPGPGSAEPDFCHTVVRAPTRVSALNGSTSAKKGSIRPGHSPAEWTCPLRPRFRCSPTTPQWWWRRQVVYIATLMKTA